MNKCRIINQFGDKSFYIEKNQGTIYINEYIAESSKAFEDFSFELVDYRPTINPPINRSQVEEILAWIDKKTDEDNPKRVGLVYGRAGIGKSVVMSNLLQELRNREEYIYLGLKSDQIEFVDTDDLAKQMHLAKPLIDEIRDLAKETKRVVLLIDQIDALSLSLSSNRTSLRSLLKLVEQARTIPQARIVISCRPYDIEYDPILEKLKIDTKWEIKEFTPEEVKHCLFSNGCNDEMTEDLIHFLGNPLHLYLFLKVRSYVQLKYPLTEDILYGELWHIYILNADQSKIDKTKLIEFIDCIVNKMYANQELSIHYNLYVTKYEKEISYLLSTGLLILTSNRQLQFFHQTMFDYAYARRFAEQERDLLEEIKSKHQGLFIRSRVKSILSYQRDIETNLYINTLHHLLYDKNEYDESVFRFHLKSLAISSMAFFEKPIQEEYFFILNKLFVSNEYMSILLDAIHNKEWLSAIRTIINKKGGWNNLSTTFKEKIFGICRRLIWTEGNYVIEYLNEILNYGNEEDRINIISLLNNYSINCNSDKLKILYNRLVQTRNPLQLANSLRIIAQHDPWFVFEELKQNIKLQLAEKERVSLHRVTTDHEIERIYETLEKEHDKLIRNFYLELLYIILDYSSYQIDGYEIKSSLEFSHFQRTENDHLSSYNFTEALINKILDRVIKEENSCELRNVLHQLINTNLDGLVFIALYKYTHEPEKFIDDIYDIFINKHVFANAPCMLEYQAIELLKKSFPLFEKSRKEVLIETIMQLNDKGEHVIYKDFINKHLEYGIPISQIGRKRGIILNQLPTEELRNNYKEAYQELLRMKRKFKYLDNQIPYKTYSRCGWQSLSQNKTEKMNVIAWKKSMIKYNNDNNFDWDIPTLTGQAMRFRECVKNEPLKYLQLLNEIIDIDEIPIAYSEAGMRGLLDVGLYADAEIVFSGIVRLLKGDVNSTIKGFSLHSFLISIDDFLKEDKLPKSVFDFLCLAVTTAKEESIGFEQKKQSVRDIYDYGINQPRGHAGYQLVKCAKYTEYGNTIFTTLESIAEKSSEFTRAAILLNLAILNNVDKERNVILFKRMLHDYHPSLLSMPIHNYNPLIYFINYAFEELIEYFENATKCKVCHKELVIVLWLAWRNTHNSNSKFYLDTICKSSEDARISLLNFLHQQKIFSKEAIEYMLYFMDAEFDSDDMAKACDNIFYKIGDIDISIKQLLAEKFVSSPLSKRFVDSFYDFLASYSLIEPIQSLKWLEQLLLKQQTYEYERYGKVADVLIQSYNGIKAFNDEDTSPVLEKAMDIMDGYMKNSENKHMILNFIHKLDNE